MCSSTCPCSLSHDPRRVCMHSHRHASAQARHCVCSPGKRLSRNLLPALTSLLHPSRYLWGKGWGSGERRAEVRGQQSPTGQLLFGDPQAAGQAPAFLSRKMCQEVGEGPGCSAADQSAPYFGQAVPLHQTQPLEEPFCSKILELPTTEGALNLTALQGDPPSPAATVRTTGMLRAGSRGEGQGERRRQTGRKTAD